MPIKMGNKTYTTFSKAVTSVKKNKSIKDPKAYVAAVEAIVKKRRAAKKK